MFCNWTKTNSEWNEKYSGELLLHTRPNWIYLNSDEHKFKRCAPLLYIYIACYIGIGTYESTTKTKAEQAKKKMKSNCGIRCTYLPER